MTRGEFALRYAPSFLVPLLASFLLAPWAARLARRWGVLDLPLETKFHLEATPYLGGLAVAGGVVLVGAVVGGSNGQLLTILVAGLAIAFVGLMDDWRTVRPWLKLTVEVAAAVALWLAGVRAGLFGVAGLDLALTVLWVVAITNSVNLLDNMNGLASGVAAISALAFFAIAAGNGDYLVASFALAIAGASLGFHRHNFPTAHVFLGDAGSLLLGFLLAALGLKLDLVGQNGLMRAVVPAFILCVPIFDTLLVIAARLRGGRPLYQGGTDHSSHRLAWLGLSISQVAFVTYGVHLLGCALAVLLLHAPIEAVMLAAAVIGIEAVAAAVLLLRIPVGRVVGTGLGPATLAIGREGPLRGVGP
jgi:UDP-GlcNAc:undecaprenyl-phosphate/decaprenyl-phosphate GlcNAc-1-phosphate transferase